MTLHLLLLELTFFVVCIGAIFTHVVAAGHLFEGSRSRVLLRWHMPTGKSRVIKQEMPWASPYAKSRTLLWMFLYALLSIGCAPHSLAFWRGVNTCLYMAH